MILFANDLGGNRIYIEDAIAGGVYYCEGCRGRLVVKNKGSIRQHHFAHMVDALTDAIQRGCMIQSDARTENQMSEWHRKWQEQFPLHQREVVKKSNGKIFRADICLEEKKLIIEFQHSKINSNDFHARNEFYNSIGYKVLWLFDFDRLHGKFQLVYPEQYDRFTRSYMRMTDKYFYNFDNRQVYRIYQDTYREMFGEWKPPVQIPAERKVVICFMYTHNKRASYSIIDTVTGSFEYENMPFNLFVREIEEQAFLKF